MWSHPPDLYSKPNRHPHHHNDFNPNTDFNPNSDVHAAGKCSQSLFWSSRPCTLESYCRIDVRKQNI